MGERPLLRHLAQAARSARLEAGLFQIDIATRAGVSHETVASFERAQSWPRQFERILAAYETETGRDRFAIVIEAVHAWREEEREHRHDRP